MGKRSGLPHTRPWIGDTTVPGPRKRAPLRAVPDPEPSEEAPYGYLQDGKTPRKRPMGKGADSPVKRWEAAGRPIGKNRAAILANSEYNAGPDMPPGKALSWLPTEADVPPKPTAEPKMEYPGMGHSRNGHPEWALFTEMEENAKDLEKAGKPWVIRRYWVTRWVPPEERRCQARAIGKFSAFQGNRCSMRAIKGGRVCVTHGGKLANVKKAAQTALATAALPAAEKLIHIALKKRGVTDADRIKALIQILDRAGVEGKSTLQIEVAPWQQVLEKIYAGETGSVAIEGEVEGVDYEVEDDDDSPWAADDDDDDPDAG